MNFYDTPLIVFRVDASIEIGNGHVVRCLTLANELRERGAQSIFIYRSQLGDPCRLIETYRFRALKLEEIDTYDLLGSSPVTSVELLWSDSKQELDATQTITALKKLNKEIAFVIVDNYALGAKWEQLITSYCPRVLAVDDLANRRHHCCMLIDQNYYVDLERRYENLVPTNCKLFLGPKYAMLRPEFRLVKAVIRERKGPIHKILVAFGSNDPSGETIKTLLALRELNLTNLAVDVVVGALNPRRVEVKELCASIANCKYHEQIDYMACLILKADLAIGAGGATALERCALGLPSLTLVIADNQLQTTIDTASAGAAIYLGRSNEIAVDDIADAVKLAIKNPARNHEISKRALRLVPSTDGAQQLATALLTTIKSA